MQISDWTVLLKILLVNTSEQVVNTYKNTSEEEHKMDGSYRGFC